VNLLHPDEECIIAAGFDAEEWAAKATLPERNSGATKTIERFARVSRKENPGTARCVIQREGMRCASPPHDPVANSNRRIETRARVVAWSFSLASYKQRWVNRCLEGRMRVRKIIETHQIRSLQQQLTNTSAGERAPKLRRKQKRHYCIRSQQSMSALYEERCHIYLCGESTSRTSCCCSRLPRGVAVNFEVASQFLF
jgi:hypothetical protein